MGYRIPRHELNNFVFQNTSEDDNLITVEFEGTAVIKIKLNQQPKADGTPQCSISILDKNNRDSLESDFQQDLENICDMSGLYSLDIEFIPSNDVMHTSDNTYYFVGRNKTLISKRMSTLNEYQDWCLKIFNCLEPRNVYLVPDTNFILRRYYSNFFKEVIKYSKQHGSRFKTIQMGLSRLTILEIEDRINKAKEQIKTLKLNVQRVKDIIKKIEPEIIKLTRKKDLISNFKSLKKLITGNKDYDPIALKYSYEKNMRINFQALTETLTMILERAELMPPLEHGVLTSFAKAQGTGFADAWIRNEIATFKKFMTARMNLPTTSRYIFRGIIFLTSDLTSALASIAENNNTMYIYRNPEINQDKRFGYEKIALLIYNSVITFGTCYVVVGKKRCLFEGIWDGKTPDDWRNELLLVSESLN
jgi:hypothetical protein